jgi:cardiolipin synthase (CMP-forming)
LNIPNFLTALRILIVPIFGYFLMKEQYLTAILLFLVGGLTDILDGYIARKYDMITSIGKLADPLADKLMQITALIVLVFQSNPLIPVSVLIIVVAKEAFMVTGSMLLYKRGKNIVSANWYGKLATVILYSAIFMTIIVKMEKFNNKYTNTLIDVFVIIAVIAALFAFFMYSMTFKQITKDSK